MVQQLSDTESDLYGQDSGGFLVLNVDAPMPSPYPVLEGLESGGYYPTLQEARVACRRFREESGNDNIYIYALVGVSEALEAHPCGFQLA